MTANRAHTPTTGQVETGFALYLYDYENIVVSAGRDRFKAWLAARDARIEAAAEQRGAVRAWVEGVLYAHEWHNNHAGLSPSWKFDNPYRADQEGDDD